MHFRAKVEAPMGPPSQEEAPDATALPSGHIAEFHLELVSVGAMARSGHDDARAASPALRQGAWAALAASLVPGQHLRLLHVGGAEDAHTRPYRLLLTGMGLAPEPGQAAALAQRLRSEVSVVMPLVAPDLGLREAQAAAHLPLDWPKVAVLQPAALALMDEAALRGFNTTDPDRPGVRLPLPVSADVGALAAGVDALASCPTACAIQIDLVPHHLSSSQRERVQALTTRLLDVPLTRLAVVGLPTGPQPVSAAMAQAVDAVLRGWMLNPVGVRMTVSVRSADGAMPPGTVLNIIGSELWQGRPFRVVPVGGELQAALANDEDVDVASVVLTSQPWPPLLPDPERLRARGLKIHHPRPVNALPASGALIGHLPGAATDQPVRLPESAWSRHCHVLGGSGTGKTRLLQLLIADRLRSGHGLILLDPHGDLFEAAHADCPPWRDDDVVSLDFGDLDYVPALNLLQCQGDRPGPERTLLIHALCETFLRMYPENPEAFGPMFFTYMTWAARLVMGDSELKATVLDIPKVFADTGFRRALIERCKEPEVRGFWVGIAARAGGDSALENIAPYIVAKFVDLEQPPMRAFLGQVESSIDFRGIMDRGGVLLVNLAKGRLGQRQSQFLGLMLTSRILSAVLSRADVPLSDRRPVHLVIDEFGSFMTSASALDSLLSEGRKYAISALLAHQNMAQLPASLAQSVLTNTGSRVLLRLGADDAHALSPWVSPDFGAEQLMSLPDRHAVARLQVPGDVTPPFLLRTLDCPDPTDRDEARARFEQLRMLSRARYCKPMTEAEREIGLRLAASTGQPSVASRGTPSAASLANVLAAASARRGSVSDKPA